MDLKSQIKINQETFQLQNQKIVEFENLVKSKNLNFSEVCFVGNDINDVECIKKAGIGVGVNDSFDEVKK